jgi:hypothetical protein
MRYTVFERKLSVLKMRGVCGASKARKVGKPPVSMHGPRSKPENDNSLNVPLKRMQGNLRMKQGSATWA